MQDQDGRCTHSAGPGAVEIGGRDVKLAQGLCGPAAVVEGVHVIGLAGQGLVEGRDGSPILAEHVPHQAGIVPGRRPLGSQIGGRVEISQRTGAIAALEPGNAAADYFLGYLAWVERDGGATLGVVILRGSHGFIASG